MSKSISFLTINVKKPFWIFVQPTDGATDIDGKQTCSVCKVQKAGNFHIEWWYFESRGNWVYLGIVIFYLDIKKKYPGNVLVSNDLQCAFEIQLNKYETAPNFIQFNQNLTSDYLFKFSWIYLFLPVLAWCDHKIVLFWSAEQFYDHIMVKTGKFS